MTIGRRDYETRRAARIERLRARAEKASKESEAAFAQSHSMSDMIPMGQPILVGHYSEKRHRRDIERINNGIRKGLALAEESRRLNRRAVAAETNLSISSDDPNAIDRLREKLSALEKRRENFRSLSKALRTTRDPKATLVAAGFSEQDAERFLVRMRGETKIPSYLLTNLGAEIRRVKGRIEQLEARAKAPEREPVTIGNIEVKEEDNRVMLAFPGKPDDTVRSTLKGYGFRWSPSSGAWQRMASPGAWSLAVRLASEIEGVSAQ